MTKIKPRKLIAAVANDKRNTIKKTHCNMA
jgi:hypothetical protein